jgi:hypothetical protein
VPGTLVVLALIVPLLGNLSILNKPGWLVTLSRNNTAIFQFWETWKIILSLARIECTRERKTREER